MGAYYIQFIVWRRLVRKRNCDQMYKLYKYVNIYLKLARSLNGSQLLVIGKLCLINYASLWGFAPFQYNRELRRIELISSLVYLVRWKVTILLATLFRVGVFGNFFYDCFYYSLDVSDFQSMIRLWLLTSLGFSGFLHLHTLWRFQEFPGIMNAAVHLFESIHGNN